MEHLPLIIQRLSQGISYMEMSSNGMYVLTGEETNKLTLWQEGTKVWDKGEISRRLIRDRYFLRRFEYNCSRS